MIIRTLLLVATAATLGACASVAGERSAGCDGRHRRPANPHGSALIAPAQPAQPALPAPGSKAGEPGGCR